MKIAIDDVDRSRKYTHKQLIEMLGTPAVEGNPKGPGPGGIFAYDALTEEQMSVEPPIEGQMRYLMWRYTSHFLYAFTAEYSAECEWVLLNSPFASPQTDKS